ncbi:glycosyltransferase family 2 protein [Tessaracoccus sp. OH4464_COT-324]|uniref:glycosyltransferase family 2 protein n=1 Tax=Tessaracoccus sp. OH4464_COT-324 TaxID=2491059 RepID=UPI000F6371A4|nr:glycosyltransferase family 2 protein [Tessaracoccus sp. OH4464_COT-324]RRD46348.1 glycosyltransferase [Tessaracoccus sp. OH4464_COT-324]
MVRLRRLALGAATAIFAARAATLALNSAVIPRLRPAPRREERPSVSILVPARDEEHNLPGLLRALARQGANEVIVFDDGLNGAGLAEADSLGVRVISSERPEGWMGKNWACWELARAASGEILVFTDADTRWEAGALDAILELKSRLGADLFSVLPGLRELSPSARLLSPLVENIVLTMAPWPLLSWDRLGKGSASGALIAIDRATYEACGGHRALSNRIQEDILLARLVQFTRVRGRRGRSRLALGGDLLGAVFYRTYRESVRGLGKSVVATHEGSRVAACLSLLAFGLTHTLPWLVRGSRWVWALRAASLLDRSVVAVAAGRRAPADLAEGLLGPITPILSIPGAVVGLRRELSWKGRRYPQSAARPDSR